MGKKRKLAMREGSNFLQKSDSEFTQVMVAIWTCQLREVTKSAQEAVHWSETNNDMGTIPG